MQLKKYSKWASENLHLARWILGISTFFLCFISLVLGLILDMESFHLPFGVLWGVLPILLYLIFRSREDFLSRFSQRSYGLGRVLILGFALVSGFSWLALGNQKEKIIEEWETSLRLPSSLATTSPSMGQAPSAPTPSNPVALKIIKAIHHWEKANLGKIKAYIPRWAWFLLMLLAAAACVFLAFVLMVVSCNFSCSGNSAAATATALLGFLFFLGAIALLVFGFYKLIAPPQGKAGGPRPRKYREI